MKTLFKNLVMLTVLFVGAYLIGELSFRIWHSTRGIGWANQVPAWCKALVLFANIVWLVVCYICGKPIAVNACQVTRAASRHFGNMTIGAKVIVTATLILFMIGALWLYWSPLAQVKGTISFRDSVIVRCLVRTHTLWPIARISQDGDGIDVIAGAKRPWISGSGYYFYILKKTGDSWKCYAPIPVVRMNDTENRR